MVVVCHRIDNQNYGGRRREVEGKSINGYTSNAMKYIAKEIKTPDCRVVGQSH